jgi:GT2 family glycosyltransferase
MDNDQQVITKTKTDVVFVVLVYRNASDLAEFLESLKATCSFAYQVIVVNSYYDDASKDAISKIATDHQCVFLNVPNKGYGTGNNRGIEYARDHFDFTYLVISNPDIIVKQFPLEALKNEKPTLYAPSINCKGGRKQNPAIYRDNHLADWLMYRGYKKNHVLVIYMGVIVNHLIRGLFFHGKAKKIFECHGSFVIFNRFALEALFPVYDENIFLFCEEADIAFKAQTKGVVSYYCPRVSVYHKEDGSMKISNVNVNKVSQESYAYVYNKWRKKKKDAK